MREIKFRGWDQEAHDWNNKYSTNVGGEHNPLTEMYDWEALKEYSMDILELDNKLKIMQFTGLKDKNGVDIYEGDIIKGGTFYNRVLKKKRKTSFIIYRHHGFWVNDEGFGYEGEDLWDWEFIEVIGNVYENPELLPPLATN